VTEGEFHYQIKLDTQIKLQAGDAMFVPPFVPHSTYRTSNVTMKCIVVKFSPIYLYPTEVTPSDIDYLLVEPSYTQAYYVFRSNEGITAELTEILKKTLREHTEQTMGFEILMRAYLSSLYVWLLRNCSNNADQRLKNQLNTHDALVVHNVLQFLTNNYQHKISMSEISEMCGMNYSQFSVFFKNVTGKNFNQYLLDMRLNYAQKELLKGECSISEIATKCGFEYVSYFIQQFKLKYGMTPKQYQKTYQTPSQTENHATDTP